MQGVKKARAITVGCLGDLACDFSCNGQEKAVMRL